MKRIINRWKKAPVGMKIAYIASLPFRLVFWITVSPIILAIYMSVAAEEIEGPQ